MASAPNSHGEGGKLSLGTLPSVRWRSLLFASIVAGVVAFLLEPWLQIRCAPISDRLAELPRPVFLLSVVMLGAFVLWIPGRGRWRGVLGLQRFKGYPPLWTAMVMGTFTWGVVKACAGARHELAEDCDCVRWLLLADGSRTISEGRIHQVESSNDLGDVLSYGLLFVSATLVLWLYRERTKLNNAEGSPRSATTDRPSTPSTPGYSPDLNFRTFEELCDWIKTDDEVETHRQDRFRRGPIVDRIVRRLRDEDASTSIAVVGPVGSGKSSIRGLVLEQLKSEPSIVFVTVSAWQFATAEAAVKGILSAIVKQVGNHVNVLALRGLSEDYIAVIEKSTGFMGALARLLSGSQSPESLLNELGNVARESGLRIVLWIEDLERFTCADLTPDMALKPKQRDRLRPISALLFLLQRLKSVSLVVGAASLEFHLDTDKIVRFVESMPPLSEEDIRGPLLTLRDGCLRAEPREVVDPTSPKAREEFSPNQENDRLRSWRAFLDDHSPRNIVEAISVIVKTPRAFKNSLRLTLEIWESTPGEIDLDSVLAANVIRCSHPELFALMDKRSLALQHGTQKSGEGKEAIAPAISTYLEQVRDERLRESLRKLIEFLFPRFKAPRGGENEYVERPQSLFVDRHVNYWRRYLSGEVVPREQSDQGALSDIRLWKSTPSGSNEARRLIDRLVSPGASDQIETFVGQFSSDELVRLLHELVRRLSDESAAAWQYGEHPPGLVSVSRMMLHAKKLNREHIVEALNEIVDTYTSKNLSLVSEVMYWIASNSKNSDNILRSEQSAQVRERLRRSLLSSFVGEGGVKRLRGSLKDGTLYIVHDIVRVVDGKDHVRDEPGPFEGWNAIAETLLRFAEQDPNVGLPMIAPFLGVADWNRASPRRGGTNEERWTGRVDEHRMKQFFDEKAISRLVPLFAAWTPTESIGPQLYETCEAVVEWAKNRERRVGGT